MSNYQSKISQKATYLRVYEGGRMLYGEEVTKVIHNLEKRIVELETYLKKVQADRINDIAIERKRWAKADLVALEILRLEQQAKGMENFLSKANIMWADSIWGPVVGADDLRFCMDTLLDKAKALKEREL
jgi:hypothetical protein